MHVLNGRMLKKISTTHTQIVKALDKVIRVFKGVLMTLVTDEQGFYIISRINTLENLCNHSYSLGTLIQKALDQWFPN